MRKRWFPAALFMVLSWTHEVFFTATGAAKFLDSLPEERQWEAKVSCSGVPGPCVVFYRAEKEARLDDRGG